MICSLGYSAITPAMLFAFAKEHSLTIVDVRARPYGRVKRGFGREQLSAALGASYEHRPDLGNPGFTSGKFVPCPPKAIDVLAREHYAGKRLLLLCACEHPGRCHRHVTIAKPLLSYRVDVKHVLPPEVEGGAWDYFTASEGEAALLPGAKETPCRAVTLAALR